MVCMHVSEKAGSWHIGGVPAPVIYSHQAAMSNWHQPAVTMAARHGKVAFRRSKVLVKLGMSAFVPQDSPVMLISSLAICHAAA